MDSKWIFYKHLLQNTHHIKTEDQDCMFGQIWVQIINSKTSHFFSRSVTIDSGFGLSKRKVNAWRSSRAYYLAHLNEQYKTHRAKKYLLYHYLKFSEAKEYPFTNNNSKTSQHFGM